MTEDQLYDMTPRTFDNKAKGFNKMLEYNNKKQMELHRENVIAVIRPHLDKKHKNKSTKELYPLPWDNKPTETEKKKENPVDFWKLIDAKTKK